MAGHNLAFSKGSELRAASTASGLSQLEELLGTETFLEFSVRNPGATGQVGFNIEGRPLAEFQGGSATRGFGGGIRTSPFGGQRSMQFIDPKFLNRKGQQPATSGGPQLSTGAQQRTQARGQASTILSGDFGNQGLGVGRGTVAFKTLSGF